MKINEILTETINSSNALIAEFWKQASPSDRRYYSIRDNCGFCASEFIMFAAKKGITLTRERGYFRADEVVHDKADFTPKMKIEFRQSGLNWHSAVDRKQWIENSEYADEWHKVPHYWCIDANGNILDPSGEAQFIRTGLARDLNSTRYLPK